MNPVIKEHFKGENQKAKVKREKAKIRSLKESTLFLRYSRVKSDFYFKKKVLFSLFALFSPRVGSTSFCDWLFR